MPCRSCPCHRVPTSATGRLVICEIGSPQPSWTRGKRGSPDRSVEQAGASSRSTDCGLLPCCEASVRGVAWSIACSPGIHGWVSCYTAWKRLAGRRIGRCCVAFDHDAGVWTSRFASAPNRLWQQSISPPPTLSKTRFPGTFTTDCEPVMEVNHDSRNNRIIRRRPNGGMPNPRDPTPARTDAKIPSAVRLFGD